MKQDDSIEGRDSAASVTLQPQQGERGWHATIGSQITDLSIDPIRDCLPGFLPCLAQHARQSRLTSLDVVMLNDANDITALGQCVAQIPSLRRFRANFVMLSARPLIVGFRQNTNITSATITSFKRDEKDMVSRLAQAYSDRNSLLDPLLNESTSESLDAVDSPPVLPPVGSVSKQDTKQLLPTLLLAAIQSTMTGPAKLLRSLRRLRESIGD